MITKEQFLDYINFIKIKRTQQDKLCAILEELCPGEYCNTFIFTEYEDKLVDLLAHLFNDTTKLIEYKLYEFDDWVSEKEKERQIIETPEVETWDSVYDYLIKNLGE